MTSSHPSIAGPRIKVKRAFEQIDALDEAGKSFLERQEYRVYLAELDSRTSRQAVRIEGDPLEVPDEWSVIVGEVIHNLRSALDVLVCQLAMLDTGADCQNPRTSFPIFLYGPRSKKGARFGAGLSINGLSRRHRTLIESFQPYKAGNEGKRNRLWLLREMNNADKHRLIPIVAASVGRVGVTLGPTFPLDGLGMFPRTPLQQGALIATLDGGPHPPEIAKDFYFETRLVFYDVAMPVYGFDVVDTLNRIARKVSQVVEAFAAEFS